MLLLMLILFGCNKANDNATSNSASNSRAANTNTSASVPSGEDKVEGTLTVNGSAVSFKHIYAWTSEGAFDESKQDVHLLLTDLPVPEEKLKGRMGLMSGDEQQGVQLTIDAEKAVIGGEVYHKSIEHGYFSSSGSHVFEPVSYDTKFVEGKVHSGGQHETFGDKWEYNATFRVKVRPGNNK